MATAHHEIVPGHHNFFNMAVSPLPTRHCQVKSDDAPLAKNTDHPTSTVTPEAMEKASEGFGLEEIGGTAQDARVSGIPICVLHLVLRRTDIRSTREAAYMPSRKGEKLIKCGNVCKLNSEVSFSQIKNKTWPNEETRYRINSDAMRAPSFLMILTASGDFAYRRDDGILVVPIGCLKP